VTGGLDRAGAGKPLAGTGRALTSVGRPRRFEPQDELRLLFEATLAVMQRNGYADVAVADILAEAGMSTRSFYRHSESKD
jgi:AcrR family transcriptional regulator